MFIGSQPLQRGGSPIYQQISGGGKLESGIRIIGLWFEDRTKGITFDPLAKVGYSITDSAGVTEIRTFDPAPLVLGTNVKQISDTINGEPYTYDLTIYYADDLTIDSTTGQFTFIQNDLSVKENYTGTISGGAWSEPLPSSIVSEIIELVYTGAFTPTEGDYEVRWRVLDFNLAPTLSSNFIIDRWAPHVFITGYRVDGGAYLKNVQNPPDISGYEFIDIEYVKGFNVLTNPDGSPQYDVNGEIQTLDGGETLYELAVALDTGLNTFTVINIDDNFGNTKTSWPFEITRIPALRYDGLTTVDEETYGTSYDGALSLIVDEGLSNETNVTPTEAPYTFTSGDYKVYNFTASYSYPTGESNSVPVVMTYKELAVEPYTPKVWSYTTDEFRADCETDSLIEANGNPTGTATLTHRSTPTYVDFNEDIYHTTDNLNQFQGVSPIMNIALQLTEAPYLENNSSIFKPEETWGCSVFFKYDGNTTYVMGREGATWGNGTSILASGSGLLIKMGGVQRGSSVNYSTGQWNHLYWQNYFNGSDWVDDLYLNGAVVYTNRSTERGTNTSNVLPLFGGGWTVDTNVDPDTEGQNFLGMNLSCIRLSDSELSTREINGLVYRNFKVLLDLKNGDSITTGFDGDPSWTDSWRDEAVNKNIKTESPNIAVSAQTFYNAMPTTPETGFSSKAPWVSGGRPTPASTQSCDFMYEKFNPDNVTMSFTQNFLTIGDYTEQNASGTGSTGAPSTLGYDSPVDEFLYGHKSIEAWLTARSIGFFWGSVVPNNSTDLRTDANIPIKDALRVCADTMLTDASNLENVYHFHADLRQTDNTWIPAYDQGDGIHPNTAGMAVMFGEIEPMTFPRYVETREQNFVPKISAVDPEEGGTVFVSPYDFIWSHDGINVSEPNTVLTEGLNVFNRQWTNAGGLTGENDISFNYAIPPLYNPYVKYPMDAIVASEFHDDSINMINAPIQGDETISGGRWLVTAAGGDSTYVPSLSNLTGHGLTDEFTHSQWIEKTNDSGVQYISGLLPSTFPQLFGCYCNGTNIEFVVGGTYAGLISGINIARGRTHIVWQNRYTGSEWVIDVYLDGALEASFNGRGTNTTLIEAMVGAKSTSNTDATATPTQGLNGYIDTYQFFKSALTAQQILDIYNAEV